MTRLDIKLDLPDNLAKEAKDAGLLEPKAAPLSMEEIQAEIEADRAERRNR